MVIAFTVFLLVRCHKGPPFGLRFGESSDGLDDSRASEESFPSEKVVLPIVTTGGFHGKHTGMIINNPIIKWKQMIIISMLFTFTCKHSHDEYGCLNGNIIELFFTSAHYMPIMVSDLIS